MRANRYIPCLLLAAALILFSCDYEEEVALYPLEIQLVYSDSSVQSYVGARVELKDASSSVFVDSTDINGVAHFTVPAGIYEVSSSGQLLTEDYRYIMNGIKSQIVVGQEYSKSVELAMTVTRRSSDQNISNIIMKEVYHGGVMRDDGSGNFAFDKCIILYNNGAEQVIVHNLCFAMCPQYNAHSASMGNLYANGKLVYEDEGFLPAQNGIWYFPSALTIEPYSQVVVNVHGAIDNTLTVSNSVNYANPDYYCMYDPEYFGGNGYYNNTSYYPTPAEVIPTSHYLKTVKYGLANAWPLSAIDPAIIIFQTQGITPVEYGEDADNLWYVPGYGTTSTWACLKIPREWVIDGIEVFGTNYLNSCMKRLTADVDGGYVAETNQLGHSLYRNVDKVATEALPENVGRLVYHYALGYENSTDPSGIDAEASMKKGAHIVFLDTNNSSNDFHERQKCSLRGE